MKVLKPDDTILDVNNRSDLLDIGLQEYISNRNLSKEEATTDFLLEVIKEIVDRIPLTDDEVLNISRLGHFEAVYNIEDK